MLTASLEGWSRCTLLGGRMLPELAGVVPWLTEFYRRVVARAKETLTSPGQAAVSSGE